MRRAAPVCAIVLAAGLLGMHAAAADHAPSFAVPSMPGVPVVVNGQDVSWAVVEGDWGLYRPGHGAPTVTYGHPVIYAPAPGAYYPSAGRRPRLGRHELEPPARRGRPESFSRSWWSQSRPGPATIHSPYPAPHITVERPLPYRN